MIKLKECCCGCTLRTGALIIFWSTLAIDAIRTLFYLSKILYDPMYSYYDRLPWLTIFLDMIFLTSCTFGMAVATFGIYGTQKNRPDFFNLCYYYYAGYVGYWLFVVLVVIVKPSFAYYVTIFSPLHFFSTVSYSSVESFPFMFASGYLFVAALTAYVALIIKSCKEHMMNNTGGRGGFDPEMPDPTTLGYSGSF